MKSKFSIKSYKMHKRFLEQHITHYNGQWYCYICKLTLESSAKVEHHLQEAHQNINNKISDSQKLSKKQCKKLLNNGIVLKNVQQDCYFCLLCDCSIPSLNHVDTHLKGKRHIKCITTATGSTNVQQNLNNDADARHNDITTKIETQLINNLLNSFKTEEKNMKKSNSNNVKASLAFTKNISMNKLEEYNINNKHSLIATTSTNSENIAVYQEEKISGLYMSSDIAKEIHTAIEKPTQRLLQSRKKKFHESVLDRYNKMYQKKFLHLEDVIFVHNKKKLDEIRSNLQFYVPYFNDMSVIKTMCCFLCNFTHSYDIHKLYKHIYSLKHATQLMQLSANNEQRKLSRELIKIESTYAKCYACNKNINSNAANIEEHIHFHLHKKYRKQKLAEQEQTEEILKEFKIFWYSIQYFACVICNIRFGTKMKFMEHLDAKHKTILNKKDDSKFDFCLTCATLWYDDKNLIKTYLTHCATRTHRYLTEHNGLTVTLLPQMFEKLLQNIDKTIADLFEQSMNMLHDGRPEQLKNALKEVFKICNFQKMEVCLFGSRFTGLALQNSDIDIYLNFDDEYTGTVLIKDRIQQIQNCLETEREKWEIKSILDSSRTPIIKVRHRSTGLDCDISFTNGLSLENSKLIKSFNMTYPACHKLILFLKKWLSLGDLTGFNGITNYALTWLVIFYLQIKYKIPSIFALIKSHNQSKIVSGWETGISDTIPDTMKVPKLEKSEQMHTLLLEFFKYYGSFDYMHYIICPLLGKKYPKESFTEGSTLPSSMSLYVTQLRGIKPEYFRIDSPMCVQDPFDLAHNLTKAVPILTVKRFKHYCNKSASMLELCKKTK